MNTWSKKSLLHLWNGLFMFAIVVYTMIPAGVFTAEAQDPPNPMIGARANADRVEGSDWPLGTVVTLTIEDPATPTSPDYQASTTVEPAPWDPNQTWFHIDFPGVYDLKVGDIVTATGGSTTKQVTVSNLLITSVDLGTDIVSGTADANVTVSIWVCPNGVCVFRNETVDGTGHWSTNFSIPGEESWEQGTADIGPGAWIDSAIWEVDGDGTIFAWSVPGTANPTFGVRPEGDHVEGWGWPLEGPVTIEIDDPITPENPDFQKSTVVTICEGKPNLTCMSVDFAGEFDIKPGDLVRVISSFSQKEHIVSSHTITDVDLNTDIVSGIAEPGQIVNIWTCWRGGPPCANRDETADGTGRWSTNFSLPGEQDWEQDIADVRYGSWVDSSVSDSDEDLTWYGWSVRTYALQVLPAYPAVQGYGWVPNSDVTLIIDDDTDPNNGVLYTRTKNVELDPWCGNPCFELAGLFDLQVDQYVTLTDGTVTKTVQVSPLRITSVDAANDTLSGMADAGSDVMVNVWSQDGKARHTTADTNGNWTVDFSIFGDEEFEQFTTDIKYGDTGRAIQLSPYGTDDGTQEDWNVDWVAPPSIPLVFAISYSPDLIVPRASLESIYVLNTLNDSLFRFDKNGNLQPLAATGYSVSPDGSVYTVSLRPGAVWSDGEPVTAQHFVDGILRVLDPNVGSDYGFILFAIENAQAFNAGDITDPALVGVRALDVQTLEITLEQPTSHFPSMLVSPAILPARQDVIDEFGEAWTLPANYVSNGLYRLVEIDSTHVVVEQNPLYNGPVQATFPQIAFDVIPDPAQQIMAYKNGEVDALLSTPVSDITSDPGLAQDLAVLPSPGLYYIGLSTQVFPTNNPLVRKALASAIDRQILTDEVLNTSWRVEATGLIPPELDGYQGSTVGYSYDSTGAQAFLTQAGYPGGAGFPTLNLIAVPNNADLLEEIAAQWEAVLGITVTIDYVSWGERMDILAQCRENPATCPYNGYLLGWLIDYPDAYNLLNDLFHPDSAANYTQWDNTVYRNLLDLAVAELDPAQRMGYLQQAQGLLVEEDAAIVPLFHLDSTLVVRPGIFPYYSPVFFTNLAYWSNVDPGGDGLSVAVIGTEGGTVSSENDSISAEVPAGALVEDVNLSVTDLGGNYQITATQDELDVISGFSIQPHGLQFSVPVTLTFAWDDADNDGLVDGTTKPEANIFLMKDGEQITPACSANPNCDMNANLLTVEVLSLSRFELVTPNQPPTDLVIMAPVAPVAITNDVTINVSFNDLGDVGPHDVMIEWGDGTSTNTNVSGHNAVAVHRYSSAGVYTVTVTVSDSAGESARATFQYIVIYDPTGGFVTGSGWITSPLGAYTPDPTLIGRATFGFVSKYQKGASVPTGITEFQFHVANLNFKSTYYDWLVIAGTKAQYKGTGTVNGTGNYGFLLTTIDGTPDKFRIKIWDKATGDIIYDNMLGAADDANPSTAIEGGSIVIHKPK